MNHKINLLNIKKSTYKIALLLCTILLFMPRIISGYWMFTDDGSFFLLYQKVLNSLREWDVAPILSEFGTAGRFNPLSIILYSIRFILFGNNYTFYILGNVFIVGITVILIYDIINKIKGNSNIAFLISFVFLFSSINIENYYRFFPYESIIVLALSIALNILIDKNGLITENNIRLVFSITIIALTIFIKETMIILPAVTLLVLLTLVIRKQSIKQLKPWIIFSIVTTIVSILFLVIKSLFVHSLATGFYSSLYSFNIIKILLSFGKYLTIYLNGGGWLYASILVMYYVNKRSSVYNITGQYAFYLFLLFSIIFSILILLPWEFALARYLLPTNLFLLLIIPLQVDFDRLKSLKAKYLIYAFVIVLFAINGFRIYHMNNWMNVRDKSNKQLIEYLTTVRDPLSKNIYFVYEEKPETISQVRDLLDYLHNIRFKSIDNYKDSTELNSNDILIFPYQTGDGHISSDKFFNNLFSDSVYYAKTTQLITLKKINNYSSSFTIYPDFFIFKMIKQFNISIPESVMGSYSDRDFIEKQILSKRWDIYSVI